MDGHTISQEERFFISIYGYEDIKKLLVRCIFAKEPTHVLLKGPPACCKTVFLLEMARRLDKTYFTDATSTTGSGMIDYLFENNIKYSLTPTRTWSPLLGETISAICVLGGAPVYAY
jgi:hypothetical protein